MSETDWKSHDLKIFIDCSAQMQQDEILYNNEFNPSKAMKSASIGSQRIDSHLISNGIHSIEDYISKGNYLPDENITNDEIRQVQGKLLDCMMARFNGHNIFQTILTCIYVHKEYTIKNPLFRTVIYGYLYLILTVEDFVNKYNVLTSSTWENDGGIGISYLPEKSTFEPNSIRADLEKFKANDRSIEDIVNFTLFLLDFSDYLLDFQNKEVPQIPSIPKESATFGFSDVLHNRQLSFSIPPIQMQIKSHEKSVQQLKEMINLINEFKEYKKPTSLLDLLIFIYNWTTSNSKAIILTRFILGAILLPNPNEESFCIYGWSNFKELLTSDFKKIHIKDSIFDADKVITIESTIYEFVTFVIHQFLMPLCIVHSALENRIILYWNMVCDFLNGALIKTAKFMSFPKTDSESMNKIVENPMINYTQRISLEILNIYLKLGFKCGIYNVLDYGQIFLYFSIIHKSLKNIYYDDRLVSKVYDVFEFQNRSKNNRAKHVSSAIVLKKLGEESNEELAEMILSDYFEYCVYYMQFILKTNSIKIQSNNFYNEKIVFENRRLNLTKMTKLKFIEFDNYKYLYDQNKYSVNQILLQIKRKADEAKELIKRLNSRQNHPVWIKDILKRIITASLMLTQWKEGDTFNVSFDTECIPSFQLIKA